MALTVTLYRGNAPEVTVRDTNIVPVRVGDEILGRSINGDVVMFPRPVISQNPYLVVSLESIRAVLAKGKGKRRCRT